jgi:hypothetical protein
MKLAPCLLLAVLACGSDSTSPVDSMLQNDNFSSGNTPAFQGGFATGEAAAVRLGPRTEAFTIKHIQFLFGGAAGTDSVTLTIYQDAGATNPGTPLHSADYQITASDAAMQDIDVSGANIHVAANQTIRVAIGFQHNGLPGVAKDGAITNGRNLIFVSPGNWATAESVGIDGDFVIRAEISTP